MHSIARSLGAGTRRLAVGASGAAAGAAVAPGSHPASARAPVSIETASPPAAPSKFSDEYEIIDGNGDVIGSDRSIFPLEDVAAAAAEFRVALQAAHHTPPAAEPVAGPSTAHDVGAGPSCARGSSSGTSDGADADAFIEGADLHLDATAAADDDDGGSQQYQQQRQQLTSFLDRLPPTEADATLHLACLMLRRPGMQHEVIQALYTDPEIARTMSAYINGTLAGGVFSVRGLLEPPPAESQQGDDSNDGRLQASDDGRFPLDKLLDDIGAHIANVGRKLGDVVKSLGDALSRWVDGLLKPYGPAGKSAAGGGAQRQQQPGQPPIADGGRVLSVALTIAALLVVMLLVRKPIVVRRNKHGPAFA